MVTVYVSVVTVYVSVVTVYISVVTVYINRVTVYVRVVTVSYMQMFFAHHAILSFISNQTHVVWHMHAGRYCAPRRTRPHSRCMGILPNVPPMYGRVYIPFSDSHYRRTQSRA